MKPEAAKTIKLRAAAALCLLLVALMINLILSQLSSQKQQDPRSQLNGRHSLANRDNHPTRSLLGSPVIFAEAGKKKKKEKSEVVVISVNNAQPKGYGGGGGWPIYVPTCGGGGGGGFGGFGRRKRRSAADREAPPPDWSR